MGDEIECVHHETVVRGDNGRGEEIGTCQKCGQVKRYFWYHSDEYHMVRKSEIITEGRKPVKISKPAPPATDPQPPKKANSDRAKSGPFGKLDRKLRNELFKIGPKAFGAKYGYTKQGLGPLVRQCRRNPGRLSENTMKEVGATMPEKAPAKTPTIEVPEETPVVATEKAMEPTAVTTAPTVLPPPIVIVPTPSAPLKDKEDFETATEAIISRLSAELKDDEGQIQKLSIRCERRKLEIIAYGTALDMYRLRFGSDETD
jgi:hypothetical protein